jgi:hypothetical protein
MQNKLAKLYLDGRRATGDMMEEVLRETRGNKQPAQISGLSRQDQSLRFGRAFRNCYESDAIMLVASLYGINSFTARDGFGRPVFANRIVCERPDSG